MFPYIDLQGRYDQAEIPSQSHSPLCSRLIWSQSGSGRTRDEVGSDGVHFLEMGNSSFHAKFKSLAIREFFHFISHGVKVRIDQNLVYDCATVSIKM